MTKSSPQGTFERPFNVGELAIGAQGTFFARGVDNNPRQMAEIFLEAASHKGTSLVEILQNCVIFSNKIHDEVTSRETKDDNQLHLVHGEPMIFGKEKDKGIVLERTKLKVVHLGKDGYGINDLLVHDKTNPDSGIHMMLSTMAPPAFPVAVGVIRSVASATFEDSLERIIDHEKRHNPIKNMDGLLHSGKTWEI